MSQSPWMSTMKPKVDKVAWQLNNVQPFNNTQKLGLHTSKSSDSTPLLPKGDSGDSEKLSSVIAQAGYSTKISNYQTYTKTGLEDTEGAFLGPQKQ